MPNENRWPRKLPTELWNDRQPRPNTSCRRNNVDGTVRWILVSNSTFAAAWPPEYHSLSILKPSPPGRVTHRNNHVPKVNRINVPFPNGNVLDLKPHCQNIQSSTRQPSAELLQRQLATPHITLNPAIVHVNEYVFAAPLEVPPPAYLGANAPSPAACGFLAHTPFAAPIALAIYTCFHPQHGSIKTAFDCK
jgi:hypothetical protein